MRHDCPADLEDEEAVTEIISVIGAAPNESDGEGEEQPFDDGSFFTFVPEERHRFRDGPTTMISFLLNLASFYDGSKFCPKNRN